MIIKFNLLEFWKSLKVETCPLHDRTKSILNKNISESQISTLSKTNNILTPMIGYKLQKHNLFGQGTQLGESCSKRFQNSKIIPKSKTISS